jgi:uncharacterized membrane protein
MSNQSKTNSAPAPSPAGYSLVRLERVADIVFAVALLLLVVKIDFAPRDSSSAADAYAFLWKNMSQSLGFAISFLLIAYYWISHQEYFSHYTSTNKTHIFFELLFLLAIAGMPVNNDFIAAFPTELAPRFAISSDIFFAGMFTFLSWSYATSGNRLVDPTAMTPETVNFMRRQALVMPAAAIIAAGAALLHPMAWDAVLFVGPILGMVLIKRRAKK